MDKIMSAEEVLKEIQPWSNFNAGDKIVMEKHAAQFKQDAITDLAIREGEFAEWASKNEWEFSQTRNGWFNEADLCQYIDISTTTTSDLVQLFIDEKMKAK